jgi:hypothetical protein
MVAGLILCYRGGVALQHRPRDIFFSLAGGVAFYYLLFVHIPERHIRRLHSMRMEAPCAFSFLDWRGYGIMAVMITLGIALRLSGLVSQQMLGTLYVGMGVPLLLSAIRFGRAGHGFKPNA